MAEELHITAHSKEEKYRQLLPQVKALVEGETDLVANMANICSALKYGMNFFWVGFYLVKNNELVLGPFQGPVACTRIAKGKGVCGTSWEKQQTLIVPDVDQFPGHIACSSLSKSEIVLPVFNSKKEVVAVLDVDSDALDSFDKTDEIYLQQIVSILKFD
ncbi:MAG: free methionine-(R)-sulfoxide reductase [Bacteroidetes bacterium]|jgi:GAF domain-containing protein|nr:free methionine-(R)-sulfoxide reductase [Bacteroidota bacterium]